MSSEDIEYYRQRAETEREMASLASRADIAQIHRELARLYDALVRHAELRPTVTLVPPPRALGHLRRKVPHLTIAG